MAHHGGAHLKTISVEEIQMADTVKKAKAPAKPRKTAATSKAAVTPIALVEKKIEEQKPVVVTHEEISQLAHRFWAERGHQHGNPEQDWLRAEQELRGKAS
jgi:hypothetical protein